MRGFQKIYRSKKKYLPSKIKFSYIYDEDLTGAIVLCMRRTNHYIRTF